MASQDRLYYHDAYLTEFDATVTRVEQESDRTLVWLDQTGFYPTSGGQPHDIGTLQDVEVREVIDWEDGSVAHVVARPLSPGTRVRGRVDWARRFDHMQQHTGQHILSAAFIRRCDAVTVSFHLGAATATIDLAREVTPEMIAAAEDEANRIVWEDRPVTIRFATAEEAAALPLRKNPARTGVLRLVDVDGFDLSACGGTHPKRTGAVGVIAVTGSERFRGGTRIEFVCGGRALAAFQTLRDTVAQSIRLVSVLPAELPVAVERVQSENKELRRGLKSLQERLASFQADALANRGVPVRDVHTVIETADGYDAGGLKNLALAVCSRPGFVAVLLAAAPAAPTSGDGAHPSPDSYLVVVARAADVRSVDAAAVLRGLIAACGGRGGGRPELAQGGGLRGPASSIIDAAKSLLASGAVG